MVKIKIEKKTALIFWAFQAMHAEYMGHAYSV